MEIFRKALECALAHEKNKTARSARRTYRKQITDLQKTIVDLKSVIVSKDSDIAGMGQTIETLNVHLDNKKNEIVGLEVDLREVKTALEGKDKIHHLVLQKLNVQTNLFTTTKRQLEHVTRENEDQSNQIWRMLEENCFLNKRILELDLEVQSIETLLTCLKTDLEKAEYRTTVLGQSLKHSQEGYEIKCREVVDISVREQQLRATMFNLQSELDLWKRNSQMKMAKETATRMTPSTNNGITIAQLLEGAQIPTATKPLSTLPLSSLPFVSRSATVSDPVVPASIPFAPVIGHAVPSPLTSFAFIPRSDHKVSDIPSGSPPDSAIRYTSSLSNNFTSPSYPSPSVSPSVSPAGSPCESAKTSPSTSPSTSPPTSPVRTPHPLLTPFTPSILSFNSGRLRAGASSGTPSLPAPSNSGTSNPG